MGGRPLLGPGLGSQEGSEGCPADRGGLTGACGMEGPPRPRGAEERMRRSRRGPGAEVGATGGPQHMAVEGVQRREGKSVDQGVSWVVLGHLPWEERPRLLGRATPKGQGCGSGSQRHRTEPAEVGFNGSQGHRLGELAQVVVGTGKLESEAGE